MVRRDQQVAVAAVAALWLLVGFVVWQTITFTGHAPPTFVLVVAIAGAVILFLNTMSVLAMLRRCAGDTEISRIYGPEIQCDQVEDCDQPNSWTA